MKLRFGQKMLLFKYIKDYIIFNSILDSRFDTKNNNGESGFGSDINVPVYATVKGVSKNFFQTKLDKN